MNDKEFVLALLGDFGMEVAQATADLVQRNMTTDDYIARSREQFRIYGTALLEWKNNGRVSTGDDLERDNSEYEVPPV